MAKRRINKPKKIAIALIIPFISSVIAALYVLYHREMCTPSESVDKNFTVIVNISDISYVTEIELHSIIVHHICVPYMHGALCVVATALLGFGKFVTFNSYI